MKGVFKSLKKTFLKKDENGSEKKDDKSGSRSPQPSDKSAPRSSSSDKPRRKSKDTPTSNGSPTPSAVTTATSSAGSSVSSAPNYFPDMQSDFTYQDLLKPIPSIQSAPPAERPNLFVKKLRLCSVVFEFEPERKERAADDEPGLVRKAATEHTKHKPESADEIRAKEVKRELLLELVDHIAKTRNFITEPILVEMLKMVSTNIFRALPQSLNDDVLDPEDEEPTLEPAWPHLQIVYEFFLRFIASNDMDLKILKKHINGLFVLHVLELFNSEDPRERDYLKTILHRIYSKFMSLRAFIRKAINNTFYTFIYENEQHNGVAELLEILGSIINGFALPLKQEHKTFLERVLIPMHKVRHLSSFHQQLSYCVCQFVHKDAELAVPVVKGLIRLWPLTNSQKEVLFLNELEEVLELTQPNEFKKIMTPLFQHLRRTIGSSHFQVAERSLFLWHNDYVSSLIADHRDVVLPIIFPVLHTNSQHHWNPSVHQLTVNVLKAFMEMDNALVQDCSRRYTEQEKKREQRQKQREEGWKSLEEAARK